MAVAPDVRLTQEEVVRVTENPISSPDPAPRWTWACPMPGMSTTARLTVDSVVMGDGYVHRSTRGLNPVRESWLLTFPFTSQAELAAMYEFLRANAAAGFWMLPPDFIEYVLVTADEWSWTIVDRTGADRDYVGTLQATFTRSFNPQPIAMPLTMRRTPT